MQALQAPPSQLNGIGTPCSLAMAKTVWPFLSALSTWTVLVRFGLENVMVVMVRRIYRGYREKLNAANVRSDINRLRDKNATLFLSLQVILFV